MMLEQRARFQIIDIYFIILQYANEILAVTGIFQCERSEHGGFGARFTANPPLKGLCKREQHGIFFLQKEG